MGVSPEGGSLGLVNHASVPLLSGPNVLACKSVLFAVIVASASPKVKKGSSHSQLSGSHRYL